MPKRLTDKELKALAESYDNIFGEDCPHYILLKGANESKELLKRFEQYYNCKFNSMQEVAHKLYNTPLDELPC